MKPLLVLIYALLASVWGVRAVEASSVGGVLANGAISLLMLVWCVEMLGREKWHRTSSETRLARAITVRP